MTLATARELLNAGADVLTSGNHIWAQKDIIPHLDGEVPVVRPLNYPPGVPGRGCLVKNKVMVVNLLGRTFIVMIVKKSRDSPIRSVTKLGKATSKPDMKNSNLYHKDVSVPNLMKYPSKLPVIKYIPNIKVKSGQKISIKGACITSAEEKTKQKGKRYTRKPKHIA